MIADDPTSAGDPTSAEPASADDSRPAPDPMDLVPDGDVAAWIDAHDPEPEEVDVDEVLAK